jgi:hypothetical protein
MENKVLTSAKQCIFFLQDERLPLMAFQWVYAMAGR